LEVKRVEINAGKRFQTIDGFGVNINPDQWRDGHIKPVLDQLVDDLGGTLFRFDCYGKGDWLEPSRRTNDGAFPPAYLAEVYRRRSFTDAWQMYRHLQEHGAELFFNVSGDIPAAWKREDGKTLKDYGAYAEMQATLAWWAREKEGLRFRYFSPFNETDFGGTAEGPGISPGDRIPAFQAIAERFARNGLTGVQFILFDDGSFQAESLAPFLRQTSFVNQVFAFGAHTYGNGNEGDGDSWYENPSGIGQCAELIKNSAYHQAHLWLTEYGDLDQTGEIEWEFAWRSQRRLLRALLDGVTAAQCWDAWDNFHKHDHAWARYGLFQTDREDWSYTPRKRYYAARQVFRFVRPGYVRIAVGAPADSQRDPYRAWKNSLRNVTLVAFISPDQKELTLTGMSLVERDFTLELDVKDWAWPPEKPLRNFSTTSDLDCELLEEKRPDGKPLRFLVKARSIFTITGLK
jgi:O-glycosyl hydrolase